MKSLDGRKMFWLWHPEGPFRDPKDIAEKALAAGVTAVAAKVDDGGYPFSDAQTDFGRRPDRIVDFILKLRTAGVAAGLWGYHYGHDLGREASAVHRAINFHPDFYIVDWEAEFMGQHLQVVRDQDTGRSVVREYLESIRDYRNKEAPCVGLFHAPLAQPRYHEPLLYKLFQDHFDGMMPQIYHRAMELPIDQALALCYDDYVHYGLMDKPIWPAGQAYNLPAEEVLAWGQRATQIYGAKGLSWWKFEDATDGILEAVRSVSFGGEMRRVNGTHPDYRTEDRRILARGVHTIPVRSKFGLLATDARVVLDLEMLGLPGKSWPVVIVRDGSGNFAGYLVGAKPRDQFTVYMGAGPEGFISIECIGAEARVGLFGILEAG